MTETKAGRTASRNTARGWQVGLAATLMLAASPVALHAEISNAELAKQIAELKAQIRALKGGVAEVRRTRKTVVAAPAPAYVPPPAFAAIPAGATPVFVTADKKMQFGSLTITPGGFFAMESANRTRSQGEELASAFGNVPTNNSPLAHYGESRFSARQSRAALLIEAPISKSMLVAGYGEFDFLGAGVASNLNQTDSYIPRIRHLYATLDNSDYGLHVLAGQEWSLVTLNSKGITPRNEVPPPQIDPSFIPGFEYARLPQIRVTKDFNKKLWLSLDLEASQTTGIGNCANAVPAAAGAIGTSTLATAFTGATASNCNYASTQALFGGSAAQVISFNKLPDAIAKAAYEARVGERDIHLEAFGVARDLYNNTNYGALVATTNATNPGGYPGGSNNDALGYGVGAGVIVPLLPKRLDFQINGTFGRGMARYFSTGGLPDAVVEGDGRLHAVGASSALAGVIAHVTPSFDFYAFAGYEQVNRTFSTVGGAQIGYGVTNGINNYGCNVPGGTCTGQTHRVLQLTGGVWDKLYKGSFGEVRVGVQYAYTERFLFGGTSAAFGAQTAATPFIAARANDNTILTSFRYYPFQ